MTTTYIRFSGTAEFDEPPGQPTHTRAAAPAANASTRMTRIKTSRATSHSPPPSHATRPAPAGTSPASASRASAQSRRAAGSSPAERPSSPASTLVNRSITPPLPPPGACPPGPPRPRAGCFSGACSASAARAAASPSELSRYRCRRGRPAGCPSSQHASTRPRSASRIKIGYSVPDRSPVCLASR